MVTSAVATLAAIFNGLVDNSVWCPHAGFLAFNLRRAQVGEGIDAGDFLFGGFMILPVLPRWVLAGKGREHAYFPTSELVHGPRQFSQNGLRI